MTGVLVAALLVGQALETRQEALYRAIASLDAKAVRKAVDEGASLRLRAKGHDEPPLFYALGWEEMFDLLLRLGAPVDAVDVHGRTLLHHLVSDSPTLQKNVPHRPVSMTFVGRLDFDIPWERRAKIAADLVRRGVKVEARDALGRTALHYAVQSGWRGVDLLLSLNARPNDRTRWLRGSLPRGADPDARDAEGATPLIVLVRQARRNAETVVIAAGLLLEAEADLSLRDDSGRTAEEWAAKEGKEYLVGLLKARREGGARP